MKLVRKLICLVLSFVVILCCVSCKDSDEKSNLTCYKLSSTLDTKKMQLDCDLHIDYTNNTQSLLKEIQLNLYPNAYRENAKIKPISEKEISSAYTNGMSYGGITISNVEVNDEKSKYNIVGIDENILSIPVTELSPYDRIQMDIEFILDIPNVRHRFGYMDDIINLGNFYPQICVFDNGFIQCPYYSNGDPFYSECANYDFSITVPSDYQVACTGEKVEAINDNLKTVNTKANNVRDCAFVVGKFKTIKDKINNTTINYYYMKDSKPNNSIQTAKNAIKTFSELYGNYPYKVLSVVETNFLYGGMEYPQLIYISNALNEPFYNEVIIHETAHQWWYSLVGNNQINNAWMDEGLTEFSTSYFYKCNPSYKVDYDKRIADALSGYILYMESFHDFNKDSSMTRSLDKYNDSLEYSYMIYVKGELLFAELKDMIGEKKFFNSLKAYSKTYANKIAKPDDMIACFEQKSGQKLKEYFDSWLNGKVKMFGGLYE